MKLPELAVSSPADDAPFRYVRVAAVVDEFTRASLAPEFQLLNLDSRLWAIELARFRPHFIFVESAWRGRGGSWTGKIASYPGRRKSLRFNALRRVARAARIPTVFWNKEDPVHYDRFIAAARGFDFVFTTAAEKIDDYHRDTGTARTRLGVLPFAVQPRIYFPSSEPRDARVLFAGSYGESHFPERRAQLEMLLDGAVAAGSSLTIFDRTAAEPNPDKAFPQRFHRYIDGARDYLALATEYRKARVGLNVNSVTGSATMFSRRVFEMLACGLPVVSGPGRGMQELLPGLVTVVRSADEAREAIGTIDPASGEHAASVVLAEHTIAVRFATVLAAFGL